MDPGLGLSPEICPDGGRARGPVADDLIHLWGKPTGVLEAENSGVADDLIHLWGKHGQPA